jgi:hypothetical protein
VSPLDWLVASWREFIRAATARRPDLVDIEAQDHARRIAARELERLLRMAEYERGWVTRWAYEKRAWLLADREAALVSMGDQPGPRQVLSFTRPHGKEWGS